jgi:3-oxoacyl-[acyl-carrier protein] reductase
MNLTNKVALVTGSGRGLGKAIALRLSEDGATVVINDISDDAMNTVEEIKAAGRPSLFVKANVSSSVEVNLMMETIVKTCGKIDILVNNAGITRDQLTIRMTDEEWDAVLNINLKSVFYCTRAVLKYMMKQRWGRIINISSISGILGNPGQINYCATKAGIIGMTRTVAKEMASRQITVNAVAPGFIDTDMTQKLPEKVRDEFLHRIPLACFGTPKDIAAAVSFFASDDAKYITGQVLCVDGGMVSA